MSLPFVALTPLLGALLPALFSRSRLLPAWAAALVTLVAAGIAAPLAPAVFHGQVVYAGWQWLPELGLNASFRLDGLGLLFTILILGIGLLVIIYSNYYLRKDDPVGRFYAFLLLFMASMLGIVLSDNLLLLVIFWEMTSLSSFLLIGYWHERAGSRQAARMSLIVTGAGGLSLLAGVLLLGHIAGSFEIRDVLLQGERIRNHPYYLGMLLLILGGAFTKSAQFPFHNWLPRAMEAPTPVSAYLHSATMVKAGVFLLARLFPVLAGTDAWFYIVSAVGVTTLIFGAYTALFKHDIKGLLAYSTISHLGLITLLFGFGSAITAVAGVFHIINHAIFKASLFMAAGIVDHETGTRDIRRLGGLSKYLPHTTVLASLAAASMAGVPLLNGFLSKEMFFSATLHSDRVGPWTWLEPGAAVLYGLLSVAYSARFIHDVFFNGEPQKLPRTPHEPTRWMKVPVEILVALVLLVGIFPAWSVGGLLSVAASAVVPGALPHYELQVWHGFTPAFLMSILALVGGVLLYFQRHLLFELHDRLFPRFSGTWAFERGLNSLGRTLRRLVGLLDNGSLQRYAALLVGSALVMGVAGAWPGMDLPAAGALLRDLGTLAQVDGVSLLAAFALISTAVAAMIMHRRWLTALIMLGVVGVIVSLAFVRFSAPDLALTQLSVEVVTIVLLLLALYFLPHESRPERRLTPRLTSGVLAVASGIATTAAIWAVLGHPLESISHFFLAQSLPAGGGHNVVNVILVDFRGYDTLGEITVLAIAAIGIHSMLRGVHMPLPARDPMGRDWAEDRHPLILAVMTRPLLPLAVLFSFFLFLRGHNHPGGGFVGALAISIALILQYVSNGAGWSEARTRLNYHLVITAGLAVSAFTGIGGWFFGVPFMTHTFGHLHIPLVGDVELATAMLFDLGVYLTVLGSVMLMLSDLGQLGQRGKVATDASDPERSAA